MKASAPSQNKLPQRGPPHGSETPLSPFCETDWNTERYARDRGLWWVDYVRLRFEAVKS